MIDYPVYKLVHYVGIFLATLSLAGLAFVSAEKKSFSQHPFRLMAVISHGVGLLLILLGGFGMLARLGMTHGLPGWVIAKLGLWVLLGGAMALVKRVPGMSRPLWLMLTVLVTLAAYLALYKPF